MQSFETPRYNAAKNTFRQSFIEGYEEGRRQLAAGQAERMDDVPEVFEIIVPRTKVLDDEWQPYVPNFREEGRRAALATRRTKEAKLDDSEAREGSELAFTRNDFRWWVILNPAGE